MSKIFFVITSILLTWMGGVIPVSAQEHVTSNEDWTVLFNGKDLSGWRSYGEEIAGSAWVVEDGEPLELRGT